MTASVARQRRFPKREYLTQRQKQVLVMLCDGLCAKEIATRLNIATKTVEFHRAGITESLGIQPLALLVRYAVRTGLIEP